MAAKEMYDYLSTVTPTYSTTTLNIVSSTIIPQTGRKSQILHEFDDGSVSVIGVNDSSYFDITLQWKILSLSDAGTIMDFWHDANKANGMENSFYWAHPSDGHTYVCNFMSEITTNYNAEYPSDKVSVGSVNMRVIGRKADS